MLGLVFVGIFLAGLGLWLGLARVSFLPPPRWSEARVRFLGNNPNQPKGDFGELLTAAILTQNGWRQLPSKLDAGGHGIDGLFVRPHWLTGFRLLITETKVNASPFKQHQLSTPKLIRALGDLYAVGALDWQTSAAIIRGLKWRSFAVRKEHWHHALHKGITTVRRARRDGNLIGRSRVRDTAHLMESLAMMLSGLDRENRYIQTQDVPGRAQRGEEDPGVLASVVS